MKSTPNQLKNLKPFLTSENAREAQLKGAAARAANRKAREALKVTARDFKEFKRDVLDEMQLSAVDVLKHEMLKAITDGESDKAIDIAKALAEFETPKLARIDQTNTELTTEDMTEEELDAALKAAVEERSDGSGK